MRIVQKYAIPIADITTNVAADTTPAWAAGTTYAAGAEVLRGNRIFVSAVNGNIGNDPLLSNQQLVSAPWIFKAWENRFRCFDGTIVSRTVAPGPVEITLDDVQGQDAILLFGLDGTKVTIEGYDSAETPAKVFEREYNLAAREVNNWFQWFFLEFGESVSRLAVTDIPSNVVSLELTFEGETVEIGEILLGRVRQIGRTLHDGTTNRVISLTRVDFNAYGEPTVIPAPTRVETTYAVHITKPRMQQVYDLLSNLSGQVVGAIGSENRQTTIQIGFLSIDEIPEDLPNDYIATLTLRGVT
jgi:hypothetical protein